MWKVRSSPPPLPALSSTRAVAGSIHTVLRGGGPAVRFGLAATLATTMTGSPAAAGSASEAIRSPGVSTPRAAVM